MDELISLRSVLAAVSVVKHYLNIQNFKRALVALFLSICTEKREINWSSIFGFCSLGVEDAEISFGGDLAIVIYNT